MSYPFRIAAASLAAIAIVTGAAYAQFAGGGMADLDQDGKISRQEVGQATLNHFDQIDTNADGFISPEEMNVEALNRFDQADANHDGYLTKGEMRAQAKARLGRFRR